MSSVYFFLAAFLFLSCSAFGSSINKRILEPMEIKYGQIEFGARKNYQLELLKFALNATAEKFGPYTLSVVRETKDWSTARYRKILKQGEIINVSWGVAGPLPPSKQGSFRINYPLLNNANGYRILVINKNKAAAFKNVLSLEDLKPYRIGQGEQWFDTWILKHNDLQVIESPIQENLFAMLQYGRFDAISLGILEVQNELNSNGRDLRGLSIEESVLIYYPFPIYFQVSHKTPRIAERLSEGMRIITENGTLDRIFNKHFSDVISDLKLNERNLIELENQFIDEAIKNGARLPLNSLFSRD